MSGMRANKRNVLIVGGALLAAATLAHAFGENSDLTIVPSVDLSRYAGRWYEIARYPNRFQKQCSGNVTANYRQLEDGKIEVTNECRKSDGKLDVARGKAKIADPRSNAKLRVSFFWPFYGDYWVIGLDPEYRWAVVGEPHRKYLWILSRTPRLDPEERAKALAIIRERGYDPSKLIDTPQ